MWSCRATVRSCLLLWAGKPLGPFWLRCWQQADCRGTWQKQGDHLGGYYHNVDKTMVAWASVLAVEVVKRDWNSGGILKVEWSEFIDGLGVRDIKERELREGSTVVSSARMELPSTKKGTTLGRTGFGETRALILGILSWRCLLDITE